MSEFIVLIQGPVTLNIVICLANSRNAIIRMAACALKPGENKVTINNLQRYASGQYCLHIKLLNGDLLEKINMVKA